MTQTDATQTNLSTKLRKYLGRALLFCAVMILLASMANLPITAGAFAVGALLLSITLTVMHKHRKRTCKKSRAPRPRISQELLWKGVKEVAPSMIVGTMAIKTHRRKKAGSPTQKHGTQNKLPFGTELKPTHNQNKDDPHLS